MPAGENISGAVRTFDIGAHSALEHFAWLAQPKATHPARCCARIYARPLAWGWRGAKGRAVQCLKDVCFLAASLGGSLATWDSVCVRVVWSGGVCVCVPSNPGSRA